MVISTMGKYIDEKTVVVLIRSQGKDYVLYTHPVYIQLKQLEQGK